MGHPLQETSSENLQGDPFYSHQQTSCGVRYIGDDGNYVNGGSDHIQLSMTSMSMSMEVRIRM